MSVSLKGLKERRILVGLLAGYNFLWSLVKIVVGALFGPRFLIISGITTLLIGLSKVTFINSGKKGNKPLALSIFLILIGLTYLVYMCRLFFVEEEVSDHGMIVSIAIAFGSFVELGMAIYLTLRERRAKRNDVYLVYRTINLCVALFAIVNTQNALLTACGDTDLVSTGALGAVFGLVAMILGIILTVKVAAEKARFSDEKNKEPIGGSEKKREEG